MARFTGSITGTTPEAKEGKQQESQSSHHSPERQAQWLTHADISKRKETALRRLLAMLETRNTTQALDGMIAIGFFKLDTDIIAALKRSCDTSAA